MTVGCEQDNDVVPSTWGQRAAYAHDLLRSNALSPRLYPDCQASEHRTSPFPACDTPRPSARPSRPVGLTPLHSLLLQALVAILHSGPDPVTGDHATNHSRRHTCDRCVLLLGQLEVCLCSPCSQLAEGLPV